jgi:hypothetical protein
MRDGDWRHHSAASALFNDSNYAQADLVRLEEIGQRTSRRRTIFMGLTCEGPRIPAWQLAQKKDTPSTGVIGRMLTTSKRGSGHGTHLTRRKLGEASDLSGQV